MTGAKRKDRRPADPETRVLIRTTVMELLQELTRLTKDDTLVLAAVKRIFGNYHARLVHAPVRVLLAGAPDPMARILKSRRLRFPGAS